MIGWIYCVIPEEFKEKNVIKFGRTCNCKSRFVAYGNLEVIKIGKVKELIRAERELHELARVYFGKAVYHKEYYSYDDIDKALELFNEVLSKHISS
jgi:transcriptional regulator NrdR family protein